MTFFRVSPRRQNSSFCLAHWELRYAWLLTSLRQCCSICYFFFLLLTTHHIISCFPEVCQQLQTWAHVASLILAPNYSSWRPSLSRTTIKKHWRRPGPWRISTVRQSKSGYLELPATMASVVRIVCTVQHPSLIRRQMEKSTEYVVIFPGMIFHPGYLKIKLRYLIKVLWQLHIYQLLFCQQCITSHAGVPQMTDDDGCYSQDCRAHLPTCASIYARHFTHSINFCFACGRPVSLVSPTWSHPLPH